FSSDVDVLTLAQAGTYTLLVEGSNAATGTGSYTFNVRPVADTTTTLALGTEVSDAINSPGQTRHYTFTLPAAARLYFDALAGASTMSWTLSGPAGVAVSARSFNTPDTTAYSGRPALDLVAGAYTLTVDAAGDATGTYRFRLSDLAAATPITP